MTYRLDDSDPSMVLVEVEADACNLSAWQQAARRGHDAVPWAELLDERPLSRDKAAATLRISKVKYDLIFATAKPGGHALAAIADELKFTLENYAISAWHREYIEELPVVKQAAPGTLVFTCSIDDGAVLIDAITGEPDVCSLVRLERLPYEAPDEVKLVLTTEEAIGRRIEQRRREDCWNLLGDVVLDVLYECLIEKWRGAHKAGQPASSFDDDDIPF